MTATDSEGPTRLVPAACAADCFRALWDDEFDRQVRRATLILAGDRAAAQDVVQNAFVKLHRRWGSVRQPVHYLSRAVLNGCRDELRRWTRVDRHATTPEVAEEVPDLSWVLDAVAQLGWRDRAVIVLRYYEQLSYEEIARDLDCPIGSVGPWLARAHQRLRGQIDERP